MIGDNTDMYPLDWYYDEPTRIIEILLEDSEEGEWLRRKKAWLDSIINERIPKDKKKVILYTPHPYKDYYSHDFLEFPSWEEVSERWIEK